MRATLIPSLECVLRSHGAGSRLTVFLAIALWFSAACSSSHAPAQAPSGQATASAGDAGEPVDNAALSESPPADSTDLRVSVSRRSRFVWPATGEITTYFGPGHPNGIDIGLDLDADSPIRASAPGTVSFAGGKACCDYGYFVVVDHDYGASTLYAHLSEIMVTEGQRVEQGDVLGLGGDTGNSTGKHLHFEVHQDDRVVDPFRYLAAAQASPASQGVESDNCASQLIAINPDSTVDLKFAADGLAGYRIGDVSVANSGRVSFPAIHAEALAPLEMALSVPASPSASGTTFDFRLDLTFLKDDDQKAVTCALRLRTLKTLPNPLTPSRTPTKTPAPTLTPTRTPRPKPTETPIPTPPPPTYAPRVLTTPTALPTAVSPSRTATPPKK